MALFEGPIETKVQATSLVTFGASLGIAVLNAVANNSAMLGHLPPLAQFLILTVAPPTLTFLAGYVSPSTPRPDLYTYAGPAHPWLPEPPVVEAAPVASPRGYHDEPYPTQQYGAPSAEPAYAFNNRGRHRA